ncbi:PACE efflux transporter [Sulfitobacter sp. S0837]|uniref:PACE efflux transporter n=1 Tax=Sulfitobacter maritimus TaxID=2741719 RepID=UPI0015823E99|nr:PACE efflux transporter [Sulfitobacter maritimus]NUH65875.1 PACE efflux transporter [Sulfitobacter maritimus]
MRKTADRIRHAISFEVLALLIVTPAAALIFDKPLHDIGVVTVVSASIATAWNYLYNLGFDHAMKRLRGTVRKTVPIRVLHAVSFEVGLLFVLMPFIAWYLGVSLMEAFLIDVSFAVFYLIYAFVFNWLYDVIFPVPETAPQS